MRADGTHCAGFIRCADGHCVRVGVRPNAYAIRNPYPHAIRNPHAYAIRNPHAHARVHSCAYSYPCARVHSHAYPYAYALRNPASCADANSAPASRGMPYGG